MRVDRESLLSSLEAVVPGLSNKETVEQADCFVFMDGVVRTFNEEIGCQMPVKMPGITGAVAAKPLMDVLRQMQDDELVVTIDKNGSLCFKGKKGRVVKMRMQAEILLPLANIEIPEEWHEIPPEYCDALLMVHECATEKDEDRFYSTCVHIGKGRIEATDNISQLMRYRVKTRISRSSLLKKRSAMHVAEMGAREFAETERFLHYRNDSGLVMSCVRYIEDYPDLSATCEVSGDRVVLPKSMGEAAKIGEVFSREQKDNNFLVLSLSRDRIMMEGIGVSGEYVHPVECIYDGPSMSFMIPPKLLTHVIDKYQEATITPERLFVQGERFVYVSRLRDPSVLKQSKKPKEEE